jgi:Protein of unknown function (DUF4256)
MKANEREELLRALKTRFEKNMHRHPAIAWLHVQARLDVNPDALGSLQEMQATGGEPDVLAEDAPSVHFHLLRLFAGKPLGSKKYLLRRPGA